MSDFEELRAANRMRQDEWMGSANVHPLFRAVEMGGEIGETVEALLAALHLSAAGGRALNVAKKLEREAAGAVGSRASVDDLADELADVVITADLLAEKFGIDLRAATQRKYNRTSLKNKLKSMLRFGRGAVAVMKDPWEDSRLLRDAAGMPPLVGEDND